MKVHLMYQNRDFDHKLQITSHEQELTQDLELKTLFEVMANHDTFIYDIVRTAIFSGLKTPEEILYRQDILKDCIKNPKVVRKLYSIAAEAIEKKRSYWWGMSNDSPSSVLKRSVNLLEMFVEMLKMVRVVVDENEKNFESKGITSLMSMLKKELDEAYLATLLTHLNELKFRNGVLISGELGPCNYGVNYVLRSQENKKYRWLKWQLAPSFYIHERDDNGLRDLGKREDRAFNLTANALAQSSDHVLSFFNMLKTELAFYVGCLNLYEKLSDKGQQLCFPVPLDINKRSHSFKGLYDVCLALIINNKVVGNDVNADGKELAIITGANQGGKSTFLRSIGQVQLMMECGMFVPAEYFCANICNGVFTHYKREEDTSMKSGKLDEELARMSNMASQLRRNSMVLFNESFAATNEREGSEIGRQIVSALLEKHIKAFYVTHLYELAHGFYKQRMSDTIYLRAERQADGHRTFKLLEGEPLQTSYGDDLYSKIFEKGMKD